MFRTKVRIIHDRCPDHNEVFFAASICLTDCPVPAVCWSSVCSMNIEAVLRAEGKTLRTNPRWNAHHVS